MHCRRRPRCGHREFETARVEQSEGILREREYRATEACKSIKFAASCRWPLIMKTRKSIDYRLSISHRNDASGIIGFQHFGYAARPCESNRGKAGLQRFKNNRGERVFA